MRLGLELEREQPRLRQRCLELRRLALSLALEHRRLIGVVRQYDEAVKQELERHLIERDRPETLDEVGGVHRVVGHEEELDRDPCRCVDDPEAERTRAVDQQGPGTRRDERKTTHQPRDCERETDPDSPDENLVRNDARPRVMVGEHADLDLKPGERSEQRPEADDDQAATSRAGDHRAILLVLGRGCRGIAVNGAGRAGNRRGGHIAWFEEVLRMRLRFC